MTDKKISLKTVVLIISITVMVFLSVQLAGAIEVTRISSQDRMTDDVIQDINAPGLADIHWLSEYEGRQVRVTFSETPPDLNKIFVFRLVKAEHSGLVMRFGNRRMVFFPYSNILSIEPL